MNEFPQDAFLLHLLSLGGGLSVVCYLLRRQGLLHWLSAGFWMAAAMALYFFLVPLMNWLTGQTFYLESRLAVTEGVSRLQWVTFMITVGIGCFFSVYLNTRCKPITLKLRDDCLPTGSWIIMILALLAAIYALILFRGPFSISQDNLLIEGGRFTGDITGYQYVSHMFALFPLVLMLAYKKTRKVGLILTACYILARFEDSWDRQSLISLLIAISMLSTYNQQRKWPDKKWFFIIIIISLILTIRGHSSFWDSWRNNSITIDEQTLDDTIAGGGDTAMLATLWVQTFLSDRIGYNYGIHFINRLLFGFFPRKYFPWKDTILKPIEPTESLNPYKKAMGMMFGAKSTTIGDLYSWAGIVTVALGMACLGYLFRRLDGMVTDGVPLPIRVLGFLWLGEIWMMFAGNLAWALACLFLTSLPFFGLYLCGKLFGYPVNNAESFEKRDVGPLLGTNRVK